MSVFHVFYCRHRTGDGIAPYAPAPVRSDRIPGLAHRILEENGDCFGLVDDDDGVLQFIYLARGDGDEQPIRMEMPAVRHGADLIRHISSDEMVALLENLPDRLNADVILKDRSAAARS